MNSVKHLVGLAAVALALSAHADPFAENFDDITSLAGKGWLQVNTSAVPGNPWFQGNGGVGGVFDAQAGAPTSYIGADYLSAGGVGAISNWLISPVLTLDPSSVLSFYTRSAGTPGFADSLGVYFSAGGGSDLSAFTLLATIGGGQYPTDWTAFNTLLPAASTGRFAFRQGATYDTADYLGIDTVSVVGRPVPGVPEPSTYALMALGIAGVAIARRRKV